MRSVCQVALLVTLVIALAGPAAAQQLRSNRLEITAQSDVSVKPDLARVTVGVLSRETSPTEAQDVTNRKMAATLAAVKALDIPESAIQTSYVVLRSIFPPVSSSEPRLPPIVGYEARNLITVRVDDLTKVGSVIDAGLSAEANELRGVDFELNDPEPHIQRARNQAVAAARREAEAVAESLGLRIRGIDVVRSHQGRVSTQRPSYSYSYAGLAGPSGASAPTPLEAGELLVTAGVTVYFKIGSR